MLRGMNFMGKLSEKTWVPLGLVGLVLVAFTPVATKFVTLGNAVEMLDKHQSELKERQDKIEERQEKYNDTVSDIKTEIALIRQAMGIRRDHGRAGP